MSYSYVYTLRHETSWSEQLEIGSEALQAQSSSCINSAVPLPRWTHFVPICQSASRDSAAFFCTAHSRTLPARGKLPVPTTPHVRKVKVECASIPCPS
nr:hypothetical protein CFP56_00821 [Quercus suber]